MVPPRHTMCSPAAPAFPAFPPLTPPPPLTCARPSTATSSVQLLSAGGRRATVESMATACPAKRLPAGVDRWTGDADGGRRRWQQVASMTPVPKAACSSPCTRHSLHPSYQSRSEPLPAALPFTHPWPHCNPPCPLPAPSPAPACRRLPLFPLQPRSGMGSRSALPSSMSSSSSRPSSSLVPASAPPWGAGEEGGNTCVGQQLRWSAPATGNDSAR